MPSSLSVTTSPRAGSWERGDGEAEGAARPEAAGLADDLDAPSLGAVAVNGGPREPDRRPLAQAHGVVDRSCLRAGEGAVQVATPRPSTMPVGARSTDNSIGGGSTCTVRTRLPPGLSSKLPAMRW